MEDSSVEVIRGIRGLMKYLNIAQSAIDRFRMRSNFPVGNKIHTKYGFVLHWKKSEVDKWILLNNNLVHQARAASERYKQIRQEDNKIY